MRDELLVPEFRAHRGEELPLVVEFRLQLLPFFPGIHESLERYAHLYGADDERYGCPGSLAGMYIADVRSLAYNCLKLCCKISVDVELECRLG